jgi:hypothetical protein
MRRRASGQNAARRVGGHLKREATRAHPLVVFITDLNMSMAGTNVAFQTLTATAKTRSAGQMPEGRENSKELTGEAQERIYRTLGHGVTCAWSNLPQPIQQELFEAAVKAEGERMREPIAQFLHREHHRTKSGMQARAIPEPDSKGG